MVILSMSPPVASLLSSLRLEATSCSQAVVSCSCSPFTASQPDSSRTQHLRLQAAGTLGGHRSSDRKGVVANAAITREFEVVALRSRKRRRGRRSGGDGSGSDEDEYNFGGPFDGFNFNGGSGGNFGNGGSGGNNGGSGSPNWGSGGYNGGFRMNKALYECMWFWQLLCAASLLQAVHFLLVGERKTSGVAATASVTVSAKAKTRA